ncbi:NucA/NucB deoxyribonuclease domain-containing protein [Nonomuraea aridisoli]|uniref:Deoxyribonuclease NucA/NucB domain-containing protein n=1 Tax=Nonomuraea aridisoli TaxID=2070368 RepID=A0A2W2EJX8_9ACTN|nr:hypothetical protein [Nonomuraea aridisoli]PZG17239.1 hypothetical protein C1J01_18590 [Nonomuraea aridisoli]
MGTAQLSVPAWDAPTAPLRIGAVMTGGIDEVGIYQRPLTAAGIADLFNQFQASRTAELPSPQTGPAPSARTNASPAATDGSFYKRVELDDCQALDDNYDGDTADSYVTWMKGEYAFGQSRIHESTYNYCWSSYIYILEFAENPFTGGMVRSAKRSLLKQAKKKNGQPVEVEDDDAFRFRATWVMHTMLGNASGKEFSQGQLSLILPVPDLFPVASNHGHPAPPKRPGHDWTHPEYPPAKTSIVTPVNKAIYGNWANVSSAALIKVNTAKAAANRAQFEGLQFTTEKGTSTPRRWPDVDNPKPWDLFAVNYCKYYFEEMYQPPDKIVNGVPNKKDVACDEYPFASTKQGAGMQDGNYSIQAVSYAQNEAHGNALTESTPITVSYPTVSSGSRS